MSSTKTALIALFMMFPGLVAHAQDGYKIRSITTLKLSANGPRKLCLLMESQPNRGSHNCAQDPVTTEDEFQLDTIFRFAELFDSKFDTIMDNPPYKFKERTYGLFPTALLARAMEQFPTDTQNPFRQIYTQAQLLDIMDRLERLSSNSPCLIAGKNYQNEMKALKASAQKISRRTSAARTNAAVEIVLNACEGMY